VSLENRNLCLSLVQEAENSGASQSSSCQVLELSVRTLQRWKKKPDEGDLRRGPIHGSSRNLSAEEKERMLGVANSNKYCNLNPHQIVVNLADSGEFIASESSFYRLLKSRKLLSHRSKSRVKTNHPPRCLIAKNPNEVWTWDITYLLSPIRGRFYYLYMVEDIFSRAIVGWRVEENESSEYAADLMNQCCIKYSIKKGQINLHSDNGSPMKGATMLATLQRLGVCPSFSRPSVSNDNPFSESLFKTLKYCPQFPDKPFSSLDEARNWVERFTSWYNTEHLHSEIRYVTPQSRHDGNDEKILNHRRDVYEKAKKKNPSRWSGQTRNWNRITEVILNPGKEKKKSKELLRTQAA